MSTTRPKLPSLKTPTTATFPSDALLSASSIRTPHSAISFKGPLSTAPLYSAGLPSAGLPSAPLDYPPTPSMLSARLDDNFKPAEKTPITPPLAYMDFLKSINPASPSMASPPLTAPLPSKSSLKRTSTGDSVETVQTIKTEDTADSTTEDDLDSVPTSATTTSDATDCSCHGEHSEKAPRPAPISTKRTIPLSSSTAATLPLSAPATGPTTFPSLRVPPSQTVESPMRSPWSARSLKSPFDWDAALKAKRYTEISAGPTSAGPTSAGLPSARGDKKATSVRHIREVVTRTVTYTPRMEPAPRGKRRKLNDTSAE